MRQRCWESPCATTLFAKQSFAKNSYRIVTTIPIVGNRSDFRPGGGGLLILLRTIVFLKSRETSRLRQRFAPGLLRAAHDRGLRKSSVGCPRYRDENALRFPVVPNGRGCPK